MISVMGTIADMHGVLKKRKIRAASKYSKMSSFRMMKRQQLNSFSLVIQNILMYS